MRKELDLPPVLGSVGFAAVSNVGVAVGDAVGVLVRQGPARTVEAAAATRMKVLGSMVMMDA